MIFHPIMFFAAGFALIYWLGFCWRQSTGWGRSAIKTASMALLAVAGAALGAPFWVVLGLGFGAIGDLCLSRAGKRMFLAGMAAFAIGHLAYAVYFMAVWGDPSVWAMLALLGLGVSTEAWLAPHTGALRVPVRGYVAVITLMGVAALGQSAPTLLAGAGLFVLSDLLLALVLFVVPTARLAPVLSILLWPAYWFGQFLILQGALSLS